MLSKKMKGRYWPTVVNGPGQQGLGTEVEWAEKTTLVGYLLLLLSLAPDPAAPSWPRADQLPLGSVWTPHQSCATESSARITRPVRRPPPVALQQLSAGK